MQGEQLSSGPPCTQLCPSAGAQVQLQDAVLVQVRGYAHRGFGAWQRTHSPKLIAAHWGFELKGMLSPAPPPPRGLYAGLIKPLNEKPPLRTLGEPPILARW